MDSITEKGSAMEPRKLDSIMIPLNALRVILALKLREGVTEMDLESFLIMVRDVYRANENVD